MAEAKAAGQEPADAELAAQVSTEQLRMIYAHTVVGTVIATAFALALAGHVAAAAPVVAVAAWAAVKVGIAVPRIFQARWHRRHGSPGTPGWQRWTDALLALDGAWFGLGGAWLMSGSVDLVAVVAASLCSVAAVATFGLQVRLRSTAAYVVPMIAPPAVALLARGDRLGLFAGLGLSMFLALLLSTARRSERRLAEVFRLRFLTDRISAERAAALEQAQRQADVKNRFLAAMNHELRTPLHGILGLARVLRDRARDHDTRHRLELIEHSGEHLLQLINDLLDTSRIEAGRIELIDLDFDLVAELEELVDIYVVRAQEKGLRFFARVELGERCWVRGDPTRLRQMLHNLLGNALKFTDEGHVALLVQRLPDGPIEFMVRDTGPGIAPEDLLHVFEPFYRASGRLRAPGSGLGLNIAQEMARAMRGSIRVDSEPGRGSLFVLTLPLPQVEAPSDEVARESAWLLGDLGDAPRRALLAEDNDVNAIVVEAMLARIGCEVTRVDNGEDAVRLGTAPDRRFDVVLMDAQMPVVDGLEATRRIRERENALHLSHVPVVALTANTSMEDREAYRAAGMDHYLGKPFTERELLAVVAACLQHGAEERQAG